MFSNCGCFWSIKTRPGGQGSTGPGAQNVKPAETQKKNLWVTTVQSVWKTRIFDVGGSFPEKTTAKDGDICSVDSHHGNLWLPKCVQVCPSALRLPGNGHCVTRQSSGKVHKTPPAPQQSGNIFLWNTSFSRPGILRSAPARRPPPPTAPHPTPPSYNPLSEQPDSRILNMCFCVVFPASPLEAFKGLKFRNGSLSEKNVLQYHECMCNAAAFTQIQCIHILYMHNC